MFSHSSNFVRWSAYGLSVLLGVVLISYGGSLAFLFKDGEIARWSALPHFTDINGAIKDTFAPGDSIVMVGQVERKDRDCYADYFYTIRGPVNYQYPPNRSFHILESNAVIKTELRNLMRLPPEMPTGVYSMNVNVYPTCNGYKLPAYQMLYEGNTPQITIVAQ